MPVLETFITGLHFRSADEKAVANALELGDEVRLVREPDNQWDSDAIMVLAADDAGFAYHIGYVPAAHNAELAAYMDRERGEAVIDAKITAGGPGRPGLTVTYGEEGAFDSDRDYSPAV